MKKTIVISGESHQELTKLKYMLNKKTLDDVIKLLYNIYKQVKGIK